MSDKPREFWICDAENDDHETGCFVSYKRLSDEEQDNNGVFNMVHVIEYAAFEKIKAENERLKSKLSIADLKTHKEKTLRILALLNECDTLKAKLAEVEAERERLEDLLGAIHDTTLEADTKSRIANNLDATPNGWRFRKSQLTREREAAKVMREALEQIQSLAANEHEQGDSKALDDVLDLTCETFKALAKAEEIRGGE